MWVQKEINLKPQKRGFHLITEEILLNLPEVDKVKTGLINIFLKHTSASLSLNENADPDVRVDMENFFSDLADNKKYYVHTSEGRYACTYQVFAYRQFTNYSDNKRKNKSWYLAGHLFV